MVEKLGSESFFFTFFPLLPNPFPASLLLLQPTNVQARGAPAITKPLIRSHSTWSTCFHLSQRLHDPDLIPPSWAIHFLSAFCLKLRPSHYLLVLCFLTHIVKSFETSPPSQMMHRTTVKPDFLFFTFLFSLMVREFDFTFSKGSRDLLLLCIDLFPHLHSCCMINTSSYFLHTRKSFQIFPEQLFFLHTFPSIEEAFDVSGFLSLIQKRLL